jgi:hypothetical protein
MAKWTAFPHAGDYAFDAASLKKSWARLHLGDCEPLPKDAGVLQAWVLFHNGEFQKAFDAGPRPAATASRWPTRPPACTPPTWKPRKKPSSTSSWKSPRAPKPSKRTTRNANAWYWQAYALGRYSQGISVAKALAQGLGTKVKTRWSRPSSSRPNTPTRTSRWRPSTPK